MLRDHAQTEELRGDIVIDASGRSGRLGQQLRERGADIRDEHHRVRRRLLHAAIPAAARPGICAAARTARHHHIGLHDRHAAGRQRLLHHHHRGLEGRSGSLRSREGSATVRDVLPSDPSRGRLDRPCVRGSREHHRVWIRRARFVLAQHGGRTARLKSMVCSSSATRRYGPTRNMVAAARGDSRRPTCSPTF